MPRHELYRNDRNQYLTWNYMEQVNSEDVCTELNSMCAKSKDIYAGPCYGDEGVLRCIQNQLKISTDLC